MDAELYLKERERLLKSVTNEDDRTEIMHKVFCKERDNPAEAVCIVEEWSKAHPIQTNAQKFEEVFGITLGTFWHMEFVDADDFMGKPYESPKGDNNG